MRVKITAFLEFTEKCEFLGIIVCKCQHVDRWLLGIDAEALTDIYFLLQTHQICIDLRNVY